MISPKINVNGNILKKLEVGRTYNVNFEYRGERCTPDTHGLKIQGDKNGDQYTQSFNWATVNWNKDKESYALKIGNYSKWDQENSRVLEIAEGGTEVVWERGQEFFPKEYINIEFTKGKYKGTVVSLDISIVLPSIGGVGGGSSGNKKTQTDDKIEGDVVPFQEHPYSDYIYGFPGKVDGYREPIWIWNLKNKDIKAISSVEIDVRKHPYVKKMMEEMKNKFPCCLKTYKDEIKENDDIFNDKQAMLGECSHPLKRVGF